MPKLQRSRIVVPVQAKFVTATVIVSMFATVTGCGPVSAAELRQDLASGGFCGNVVDVRWLFVADQLGFRVWDQIGFVCACLHGVYVCLCVTCIMTD